MKKQIKILVASVSTLALAGVGLGVGLSYGTRKTTEEVESKFVINLGEQQTELNKNEINLLEGIAGAIVSGKTYEDGTDPDEPEEPVDPEGPARESVKKLVAN